MPKFLWEDSCFAGLLRGEGEVLVGRMKKEILGMNRRRFLGVAGVGALGMAAGGVPLLGAEKKAAKGVLGAKVPVELPWPVLKGLKLTEGEEILRRVAGWRMLKGGKVPADLKKRMGCTHVSGKYSFTKEPFLLEGARRLEGMGYGCLKLWFTKVDGKVDGVVNERTNVGYQTNSDWGLPEEYTLRDLAQHRYFAEAFEMPFSCFALEVYPTRANAKRKRAGFDVSPDSDWAVEEQEVYELAKFLLEKYREREVTFILQNWEGDWMFRGGARKEWMEKDFVKGQVDLRAKTMISWFAARQRGVERARAEVKGTRCRVWHAVEVNRVFDALEGRATLTTHVLPFVKVDLLSWSCYDGMRNDKKTAEASAVGIWQGIEIMRHCAMKTTLVDAQGRSQVMLGEIGVPENKFKSEEATRAVLDGCLAACYAVEMPWIFYWELFCNEWTDAAKAAKRAVPARNEDLNGYWLVRADGTESWAGRYLREALGKS